MTDTADRPRRTLRVVLVVLAVLATGTLAVGALAYCSVFGCTPFEEDFEPHGRQATQARATAVGRTSDLVDRVAASGRVLASATRDGCAEGQHDWKRKDTYSHECELETSRLLAVSADRSDVADGLTAVDTLVRTLGCEPDRWGGLDRVRDEYWREDNPQVRRAGAAGLPKVTYTCADDLRLEVEPQASDAPASESDRLLRRRWFGDQQLSSDWYTPEDARALREAGAALAVAVTAVDPYYRTRF